MRPADFFAGDFFVTRGRTARSVLDWIFLHVFHAVLSKHVSVTSRGNAGKNAYKQTNRNHE
jgi:hypothetical protein